jgi:hypothetical protein
VTSRSAPPGGDSWDGGGPTIVDRRPDALAHRGHIVVGNARTASVYYAAIAVACCPASSATRYAWAGPAQDGPMALRLRTRN